MKQVKQKVQKKLAIKKAKFGFLLKAEREYALLGTREVGEANWRVSIWLI